MKVLVLTKLSRENFAAFETQKRGLGFHAAVAGITAKTISRRHDAMAGNEDRQRIAAACRTYGTGPRLRRAASTP